MVALSGPQFSSGRFLCGLIAEPPFSVTVALLWGLVSSRVQ